MESRSSGKVDGALSASKIGPSPSFDKGCSDWSVFAFHQVFNVLTFLGSGFTYLYLLHLFFYLHLFTS